MTDRKWLVACPNCGEMAVDRRTDRCASCGADEYDNAEPFRVGWDESD